MTQLSRFAILSLLFVSVGLQGCNSVKKTLGIDREPPNEYFVTPSQQPLEMPPDFSCLPTPMPGIERPQERTERTLQEEKLLGSSENKETLSPGQSALLDMCEAQRGQDEIRYDIDTEARMENVKGDKPILQKLGIKKAKPTGEVINPYEEAAELEKSGVQTGSGSLREVMPPSAARHERPNAKSVILPSPPPPGIYQRDSLGAP